MSKQMNTMVKNVLKCAAVAALGLAGAIPAMAGDLRIGINIGVPTPPPVVVVREEPAVVVTYDTYVVGYRRNLYDADLRLRLARADEFTAYDELQAARRHEAEVAAALDEVEVVVADLRRRVGDGGDAARIHADVLATADRCGELRKIVAALDHKIASAHEDYEAARTLNDARGMDDARARGRDNEGLQAAKAGELRETEGRLAHLREMEAAAAASAADRARLADAEARRGGVLHEVDVAHDGVYATEHRWADAHERVIVAMHERDEALWILHRDDILAGRIDVATCGFNIDLGVWGGRLPRDPEVIHAYCVRDVTYIRANPVFIEARWGDTARCGELVKIRGFAHDREPERIRVVERVETIKVEDRRRYYSEVVVTEHKRYDDEAHERHQAEVEHRAPQVNRFVERKARAAEADAAAANHNAAVAKQQANRESEKNAEQQKQLQAQSREIRRQQSEINQIKDQQNKEEAADSRASRVQRRAAEAQPAPAPTADDRSSRARRRAEEAQQQQPQQGAKTAAGAKDNGRTQGRDPQATDR